MDFWPLQSVYVENRNFKAQRGASTLLSQNNEYIIILISNVIKNDK